MLLVSDFLQLEAKSFIMTRSSSSLELQKKHRLFSVIHLQPLFQSFKVDEDVKSIV
jgi:hypothetical protein